MYDPEVCLARAWLRRNAYRVHVVSGAQRGARLRAHVSAVAAFRIAARIAAGDKNDGAAAHELPMAARAIARWWRRNERTARRRARGMAERAVIGFNGRVLSSNMARAAAADGVYAHGRKLFPVPARMSTATESAPAHRLHIVAAEGLCACGAHLLLCRAGTWRRANSRMGSTVILIAGRDPALCNGGTASYVRACGRAAIRAGYEPHVFCVGTASWTRVEPFGVLHCTESPFRPIRSIMVAMHGRYLVRSIGRFVEQRGGPCLIHGFGPWSVPGAAAARRLSRRGIDCVTVATPFTTIRHETLAKLHGVTSAHGLWTKLKLNGELLWAHLAVSQSERRGLRQSDLVLVNYDSVRAIIGAEHGNTIHFGKMTYSSEAAFLRAEDEPVTVPEVLAHLEPKNAPLIVAVSRHDARKGIVVLLRALAQLRDAGLRFRACLVGGGHLLGRHRKFAAQLALFSCTAIPGNVPDAYAYLKQADIFVLPSLEEGSGSVSLLEAMQAGAAPVVSRVDGLPEDVTEGESALLVEPGDTADLARALRLLVEDAALRSRLARGAHTVYRDRFSAEAFSADIRKAYTSLGFAPDRP